MGFFRKTWDLATPLLQLSPSDSWTIADATEGTQVFGATGSGKTSGSGAAIARAFLKAGMGGLVLVCKNQDGLNWWTERAKETGRLRDVVAFGPKHGHRFNFTDYVLRGESRSPENFIRGINLLSVSGKGGQVSRENEDFWNKGSEEMQRQSLTPLQAAGEKCSIENVHRFITSAAQSPEQIHDPEWWGKSYHAKCMLKAGERMKMGQLDPMLAHDLDTAADYWSDIFAPMDSKPRSSIISTWSVAASVFLSGFAYQLMGTTTTITPDAAIREGKIIILDMPLKVYGHAMRLPQIAWKYCFQLACEARDIHKYPRPAFLWVDEAQYFTNIEHDVLFQSTARASRCCTVYLTQSIASYYDQLGGEAKRSSVDSLMGNLQTKIFHSNGEHGTNHYASELIGQTRQFFLNSNTSARRDWMGLGGNQTNISGGTHEQEAHQLSPIEFTKLRKGGKENKCQVDAIVFQGGRVFKANGKNYLRATFKQ